MTTVQHYMFGFLPIDQTDLFRILELKPWKSVFYHIHIQALVPYGEHSHFARAGLRNTTVLFNYWCSACLKRACSEWDDFSISRENIAPLMETIGRH